MKINENMIKKLNKNELSNIVNNLQNKNEIQKNELDNLHNKIMSKIEKYAFTACNKLTDMYCYAVDVPEAGSWAFQNANTKKATLHVPAASVEAYRNAEEWKDFGNIVALTDDDPKPTAISSIEYVLLTVRFSFITSR